MFSAAVLPWLNATSQCSIRIVPAVQTESYSQMSPAAIHALRRGSQGATSTRTPPRSPIVKPARCASPMSGVTPAPITTASAGSSRPPVA